MPHFTVEYSSNVAADVDIPALLKTVHECALSTGVFPPGGVRTRAAERRDYVIGDGHPENRFVHLVARIATGRDAETKQRMADAVFAAVCDFLQPLYDSKPLAISFEVQELDPVLNFKKNNLHAIIARRQAEGGQ